ncbi:LLM class flavin-dependent oxidoreductase [Candidatus Bathyarchaeota archaeon]|nr:LLM class flavin-dependent oxidoreductase [Candidatus Bathyarchaeota archaeon]
MNGVFMRFGVAPIQWDWYWNWTVEEVLTAEKLGFDSIWILEHHGREDMYYPSPLVALAGLASVTRRVELGSCILILPLYHPVHVAEDSAMVDLISGGRLILGVGLGYRREEYDLFQIPMKDRGRRMSESLILIRKLWMEPIVDFKGVFFEVRGFSLQPKPLRKPHPPIWVGGWSSQALKRAAEFGDAWFIGPVGALPDVKNSYLKYMNALKSFNKTLSRLPLVREIYVAEESGEAYEKALKYIGGMYFKDYASWRHPLVKNAKSFEDVARDRFIVGSPDDCISQIERFSRELKITDVIFRVHYPGMNIEEGLKVIRLIGGKIKPYFEELKS